MYYSIIYSLNDKVRESYLGEGDSMEEAIATAGPLIPGMATLLAVVEAYEMPNKIAVKGEDF